MIETTGNGVTNHLAYLNHYNKDDDSSNHHIPLEALVTVANSNVTKTTPTDSTSHSGVGNEVDYQYRYIIYNVRFRFRKENLLNNLEGRSTHSLSCFDNTKINFLDGRLYQTSQEWNSGQG